MIGLDVGTSFIIASSYEGDNIVFKDFRDAFYVIKPTTPIAAKMVEKGLKGKIFIKDTDGSFVILGKDAIEKAVERNETARRPMFRGVVSVKEKDAKRILAYILKEVVGKASESGEKLVFCVPAQPVDQEDDDFDVGYHEDVVKTILSEVGYDARSVNEAEALSYINYGYPCIIWEEDEVIYKQNDCNSNHWLLDGAQGKRKTKSLGGGIMLAGFHSEAFNVLKLTQGEMDGINLQRQQKG